MPFTDKTLQQFFDELDSADPVPGGGTISAMSGALAASLLMMVARLTIGKKGYEAVDAEMRAHLARLAPFQRELIDLMQSDSDTFTRVMDAYQLPKATDAQKTARTAAIQAALQHATDVPLRVAELASDLVAIAQPIIQNGNRNAMSDAGVAALLAEAGLRGAILNAKTNLATIKDDAFVKARQARVEDLLAQVNAARQNILKQLGQT